MKKSFFTDSVSTILQLVVVLNFLMFSSKLILEEFVRRSLIASLLMKPLLTPSGGARGKFCILKCISWLEMCSHVKN